MQGAYLVLTLFILPSVCTSAKQTVMAIDSRNCFPSLPCKLDLDLNCSRQDSFTSPSSNETACNHTLGRDGSMTHCRCQSTICYSLGTFCLNACRDSDPGEVNACATCLQRLHTNNHRDKDANLCKSVCVGMCPDLGCDTKMDTENTAKCSSCAPGFAGEFCQEACSPVCSGKCHRETGYCAICPAERYGPECDYSCLPSCLGRNCSTLRGDCGACSAGFMGSRCNESCPTGFYGPSCSAPCSKSCRSGQCNAADGSCLEGCTPGYFGLRCGQQCPAQTFGQDCLSQCPVTCAANVPCHHETGACVSGCEAGFHGPHCNITCPETKFGANCRLNCSDACFRQLCNSFSGSCLTCAESFYGPLCQFSIGVDNIERGVLGSELPPQEAILMILGIVLLGVFMWVAVAYLLLHQRRRILKDAAKGIDPRRYQWGMFPNSRGFRKAVRLYDNKKGLGFPGGDIATTSKRKQHEDKKRPPYARNKKRRTMSRVMKEGKAFSWWTTNEAEKPTLPDAQEIDRVSKWLSRHHGLDQSRTNTGAIRVAESPKNDYKGEMTTDISEGQTRIDTEKLLKSSEFDLLSEDMKQSQDEANEIQVLEDTPSQGSRHEKSTPPSDNQTGHEATSLPSASAQSDEKRAQVSQSPTTQDQTVRQSFSQSVHHELIQPDDSQRSIHDDGLNPVSIRKEAIHLSPKAYSGGPSMKPAPKRRRDTSKVQWLRDAEHYSSGISQPISTSSRDTTSAKETPTTSSGTETTTSSHSAASSDDSTAVGTNRSLETTRYDSDSTLSDASTSESHSSDTSEETTEESITSTVFSSQKNINKHKADSSFPISDDSTRPKPETNDANTDTAADEVTAPSLLQKMMRMFRRTSPNTPQTQHTPFEIKPSIAGAGGLPRPYSHKFLINRLETWSRNRGLEVNTHGGMLEVVGREARDGHGSGEGDLGGVTEISQSNGPTSTSQKTLAETEAADETSWVSTSLSDRTNRNVDSSTKQSSGSTDNEPGTTTTASTADKSEVKSHPFLDTSGDDASYTTTTPSSGDMKRT